MSPVKTVSTDRASKDSVTSKDNVNKQGPAKTVSPVKTVSTDRGPVKTASPVKTVSTDRASKDSVTSKDNVNRQGQ